MNLEMGVRRGGRWSGGRWSCGLRFVSAPRRPSTTQRKTAETQKEKGT